MKGWTERLEKRWEKTRASATYRGFFGETQRVLEKLQESLDQSDRALGRADLESMRLLLPRMQAAIRELKAQVKRLAIVASGPLGEPDEGARMATQVLDAVGRSLDELEGRYERTMAIGYQRCLQDLGIARMPSLEDREVAPVLAISCDRAVHVDAGQVVQLLPEGYSGGARRQQNLAVFEFVHPFAVLPLKEPPDVREMGDIGTRKWVFTFQAAGGLDELEFGGLSFMLPRCPLAVADALLSSVWEVRTDRESWQALGVPGVSEQLVFHAHLTEESTGRFGKKPEDMFDEEKDELFCDISLVLQGRGYQGRLLRLRVSSPSEHQDWRPVLRQNAALVRQAASEIRLTGRRFQSPVVSLYDPLTEHILGDRGSKRTGDQQRIALRVRDVELASVKVDGRPFEPEEAHARMGVLGGGLPRLGTSASTYRLLPPGYAGDPPRLLLGVEPPFHLHLEGSCLLDLDWPLIFNSWGRQGVALETRQLRHMSDVDRLLLLRVPWRPLRFMGRIAGAEPLREAIAWLSFGQRCITRVDFESAVLARFAEVISAQAEFRRWRGEQGRVRAGVVMLVDYAQDVPNGHREKLSQQVVRYLESVGPVGYDYRCEENNPWESSGEV